MNIIKFFKKTINKNKVEISNFGYQTLDLSTWNLSGVQAKDELIKSTIKPTTLKHIDLSKFDLSHVQSLYDYANRYSKPQDTDMFNNFNLRNVKPISYLYI